MRTPRLCVSCEFDILSAVCVVLSHSPPSLSYRIIPLVTELREMIDWMFTDTALSLVNWLRVQEIWAQMYIDKVFREFEKVCA